MKSLAQLLTVVILAFALVVGAYKWMTRDTSGPANRVEIITSESALVNRLNDSVRAATAWNSASYNYAMGLINGSRINTNNKNSIRDTYQQNLLIKLDTIIVRSYRSISTLVPFNRIQGMNNNYRGLDSLCAVGNALGSGSIAADLRADKALYNEIYSFANSGWSPAAKSTYELNVDAQNGTAGIQWNIVNDNLSAYKSSQTARAQNLKQRLSANADLSGVRPLNSALSTQSFDGKFQEAQRNYVRNESAKLTNFLNQVKNDSRVRDLTPEAKSNLSNRIQALRSNVPSAWMNSGLESAFNQLRQSLTSN